MSSLNLFEVSHLARSIVKEAGDQLLQEWQVEKKLISKDARDIATQYDNIIEQRIVKNLQHLFPGHSIFGEEAAHESKHSDYVWYIDPIDGTKYFAANIPLFTTALGLTHKNKPILGVVYNPVSDQMYSGFLGGGAQVNYESLAVTPRAFAESIVYADLSKFEQLTVPHQAWVKEKYFAIASQSYRVRSFGCGSLGLSWIATGGLDAFVDFTGRTKFFDVCAGLAILEAAGGVYKYIETTFGKLLIAASQTDILNELERLIND